MAENKTDTKKAESKYGSPKSRLGLIGGILLAVGLAWLLWECVLRPPTAQELKEQKENRLQDKQEADRARKK